MTNNIKPEFTSIETMDGLRFAKLKGGFTDESLSHIESGAFDLLELGAGQWRDIEELLNQKANLKYMGLKSNEIEWSVISQLDQLVALDIGGWFDCDIDFNKLKKLKYLKTYWNDGYDDRLTDLKAIEVLNIFGYKSEDLRLLGVMPKLKCLTVLKSGKLKSLSGIDNFKNLQYVEISGCSSIHEIKELKKTKIQSLSVVNCKSLSDFSIVGSLSNLRELCLITPSLESLSFVSDLKKLESLRFDCKLEDGDLSFLYELPNLKYVKFNNKKNYSIKLKDIQSYLENKGHNQEELALCDFKEPKPQSFF